jgi:hypothetical protein
VPGWEQSSAAFWLLRSASWNPPDLHQLVGQPPPQLGIADNLLQLLVQKDGGAAPVDFGVDLWKEEGEEVSQIGFEDVFPQLILGRSVQSTFS